MKTTNPVAPVVKAIDAAAILDYFRRLSEASEQPAPASVLERLATLFGATGVGLGTLDAEPSEVAYSAGQLVQPTCWRSNADFVQQVRSSWTASAHPDGDGEWLVSVVAEPSGGGYFAWLYRAGNTGGGESDKLLWMLAAQALVRWMHQSGGGARNQQRSLEQAALLTSRLSHDFGNFLTGIMGFTELSLSQVPLDSALHRYLQEVLDSARQGADWIRRLQSFSRRGVAQTWPAQLASTLVQEENQQRGAGMLGMRWTVNLPKDLPLLAVDAGALQAALAELIANAREAAQDQGTIAFSAQALELAAGDCQGLLGATCPGPHVQLSITDDGPGIAPADRARLFRDLFFSTKTRHRGLGFLVVYGILQRCRGGLRIEPGPEGKGTCVSLYLPTATITGPALANVGTKREPPHLLLVHTDPMLTSSMREILEMRGCRISVASNPHAALAMLRAKGAAFDLVVTDLMMPQLAGLDMARRMLEHDPEVAFIFLLAQSSFHGLREEELLKRFDLLRWPLEPSALMRAIQKALARV